MTFPTTVASGAYDKFPVMLPNGKALKVTIHVDSGGVVDFYILDGTNLALYENPSAESFNPDSKFERSLDLAHDFTFGGRTLVVDNARIAVGGASPSGPVNYTVVVTEFDLPGYLFGQVLLVVLILVGVGLVVNFVYKRKRRAAPPVGPPTYPPPPYGSPGYGASTYQQPGYQSPAAPGYPQPGVGYPPPPPQPYVPPPPPRNR